MKNKINYTSQSRRDMDDIWSYIALELQNQEAAEKTLDRIMDTIDQLELFAECGEVVTAVAEIYHERFLVSGKYLVFYHVLEKDVFIDRVLYGGRDYLKILFEDALKEDSEQ